MTRFGATPRMMMMMTTWTFFPQKVAAKKGMAI
jgi:hypothetical protein